MHSIYRGRMSVAREQAHSQLLAILGFVALFVPTDRHGVSEQGFRCQTDQHTQCW